MVFGIIVPCTSSPSVFTAKSPVSLHRQYSCLAFKEQSRVSRWKPFPNWHNDIQAGNAENVKQILTKTIRISSTNSGHEMAWLSKATRDGRVFFNAGTGKTPQNVNQIFEAYVDHRNQLGSAVNFFDKILSLQIELVQLHTDERSKEFAGRYVDNIEYAGRGEWQDATIFAQFLTRAGSQFIKGHDFDVLQNSDGKIYVRVVSPKEKRFCINYIDDKFNI